MRSPPEALAFHRRGRLAIEAAEMFREFVAEHGNRRTVRSLGRTERSREVEFAQWAADQTELVK